MDHSYCKKVWIGVVRGCLSVEQTWFVVEYWGFVVVDPCCGEIEAAGQSFDTKPDVEVAPEGPS